MFSILHISDLHRSPSEPVDNDTLLQALLADKDRYTLASNPIHAPNAIIVSGDIVQGARLNEDDWKAKIKAQYENAAEFLGALADHFLDGDRSKIIIVPGNHDVCWNTAFSSMETLTPEEAERVSAREFFSPDGTHRWDWKSKQVLRIKDKLVYEAKCDAYWDFVEAFYAGVSLSYPISRTKGYNLFELDNGRILIGGFESTFGNDCFAFHGAVSEQTISKCSLEIRSLNKFYDLKVGVWHHGLYGPPGNTDYMDIRSVNHMIGVGFQLGMHGHQHTAAMNAQYIHAPEKICVPIISAGSLCAGARELPIGQNRQYNILMLDHDTNNVSVHIRERGLGEQFSACMRPEFGVNGTIDMEYPPAVDISGRKVDAKKENNRNSVYQFEALIESNNYEDAFKLVSDSNLDAKGYFRSLVISKAIEYSQWQLILDIIDAPLNSNEFLGKLRALEELKLYDECFAAFTTYSSDYPEQQVFLRDFETRISIKRDLNNG